MINFNTSKSLEALEKNYWKDEKHYFSNLVEKCHKYRKTPVKDLSIEQLRLLIGQDIALKYLIPIAIEKLNEDILAEGDFYVGDLLEAILKKENKFWMSDKALFKTFTNILIEKKQEIVQHNEDK